MNTSHLPDIYPMQKFGRECFLLHEDILLRGIVCPDKGGKTDFTPAALYGVPGFFFEEIKEGKGKWHFKAPMPNCIGIPLKNAYGEIVALQMRNLERNAKNKYFYVSSKYESQKNKAYGYGASPGSPVAVFYPPSIDIPTFYIGEGYFKMREIAKEGAVAFSVQGVNSLSYVTEEITEFYPCCHN